MEGIRHFSWQNSEEFRTTDPVFGCLALGHREGLFISCQILCGQDVKKVSQAGLGHSALPIGLLEGQRQSLCVAPEGAQFSEGMPPDACTGEREGICGGDFLHPVQEQASSVWTTPCPLSPSQYSTG